MERVFGELASRQDGALERELEKLRLLRADGPNPIDAPTPSPDAIDVAYSLARLSLPALRRAIEANGGRLYAGGGREGSGDFWLVAPETKADETRTGVPTLPIETIRGTPLLAACSPDTVPPDRNALDRAVRWLVARELKPLEQIRQDISARLTRLIVLEHNLWRLAGEYAGPTDRIPYAFRLRALAWHWTPESHAAGLDAHTLCIRCGELIPPPATGRPRRQSPPLCAHCAKEPPSARRWPEQAIAPDGRGDWWFTCASCGNFFVEQRNSRGRCLQCKRSAITPKRRPARS